MHSGCSINNCRITGWMRRAALGEHEGTETAAAQLPSGNGAGQGAVQAETCLRDKAGRSGASDPPRSLNLLSPAMRGHAISGSIPMWVIRSESSQATDPKGTKHLASYRKNALRTHPKPGERKPRRGSRMNAGHLRLNPGQHIWKRS